MTVPGAQTAGNLNVVLVGWADTATHTIAVTDSKGNAYQLAVGPNVSAVGAGPAAQSIYYAKNIVAAAAGTNTVTVTFGTAAEFADIRVLEYSGIDPINPVDVAVAGTGTTNISNSGTLTTTNANDLLVAGNDVATGTIAAGTGFVSRFITGDGDIVEDRVVAAVGAYNATASLFTPGDWVMQMVAFRAAVIGGDTTPPSAPANLVATASSMTQINLTWTAATDDVGVANYLIERCQGAGCTTFAQVGTSTGTTFSSTGLTLGTAYSFRVRAADAAGNNGPFSNTASATTLTDTQAPTAPAGLTAMTVSTTQINLSWTAATDNVGVTNYLVERCQGAGCTTFAQVGTSTGTTFNSTGLTASTSYSFRVRATDAAGNNGAFSNTATAITSAAPDTTPPSAPSALAATAISTTQINLAWTGSTDDVAVTSYLIERCQGAGCTTFAQVGTSTGTTFNSTGLTAGTSYSFRVRATDAAGNLSAFSNTASATTVAPDTTPPSAPSNLTATAVSQTQINLTWTASTDDVGVTSYLVERCQGAGCTTFAQVGTSATASFASTGLTAGTSYSFRVRATDAANNLGAYSNTATAATQSGPVVPAFVQGNYAAPQTAQTTVAIPFGAAQGAGDLNVIIVGWADALTHTVSVTDSKGNAYQLAIGPTLMNGAGPAAQSIYYAKNIAAAAAGANTVTVTFSPAADFVDTRILEYSGIDPTNPVDGSVAATGSTATSNSGNLTTTNANDLLVAGNDVATGTSAAGTGFTARFITIPDGDLAMDRVVNATGTYAATAPLVSSGNWVMQMVAFRAATPNADTTPPSAPSNLVATASSMTQIDLTWAAATDNVGVTNYLVERCQGAGCTTFTQVGTSVGTSFSSTGLTLGTSYSFRVRATDAASNLGAYSNTASATTLTDTTAPSAPSALTATAATSTQINLAWTAATDNVGVTGYLIERCQGVSCSGFAQVGTASGTTFSSTGLTTGTSYTFRVRATDAAGNLGPFSNTATATTPAPDVTPPSAPTNLVATVAVGNQINLGWTDATDNVGVTNYLIERCAGAGCSNFAQIATTPDVDFFDTGLALNTTYTYRVRATDAAGNLGPYSNTASGTTPNLDTTPPTAPGGLTATAASSFQVNLAWVASTDNVGVTGYLVERCQGPGCAIFSQIATTTAISYSDSALAAGTSYTYRVRARDLVNNLSAYSNLATTVTPGTPPNPGFVQGAFACPQGQFSTLSATFGTAEGAGDLNVVAIGWSDTTATISSVTDSRGNTYAVAAAPIQQTGVATHAIYYAKNIVGGATTVTVNFTSPANFPDIRIAEYRNIDTVNPLDGAASAQGTGITSSTPAITTTHPVDVLVAGNFVQSLTAGAGPGYVSRELSNPNGDIFEDQTVLTTGTYNATAPLTASAQWVMQIVAFKGTNAGPPIDATPPTASVTSPTGGTQTGTMSVTVSASDNNAVTGVQLVIDGLSVGPPDTATPYTFSFNTAQFANGAHTVGAYAWDASHNIGNAAPVSVTFSNASPGNPAQKGFMAGLVPLPIVSVNIALLSSGKVLMWDGSQFGSDARVWDPVTNEVNDVPVPHNIFCSGMDQMADGRIFVAGGHPGICHQGITNAHIFDPNNNTWTVLPDMANPRWYPTAMTMADGRMIVLSGETTCKNCYATVHEIYNPATNTWSQLTGSAAFEFDFYPHSFMLSDGRLIVTSTNEEAMVSQIFNFSTNTWTPVGGPAVDGGSAVMYAPSKFLKVGTSVDTDEAAHATDVTSYVLDMTQGSPTWRQVGSMANPRTFHLVTVLPDGNVLVSGGGPTTAATDTANAIRPVEMWSPATEQWTTMASMNAPRLYHSEAMLMPDGRVLISGGGRAADVTAPTDQFNTEFYWPPYLFKGPRPVITSAPAVLQYNQAFTVQTPNAASIAKVSLMRFGSVTHAQNMSQRLIPLSFTVGSGSLNVTAPVNANLAPPGYYMLFIVDTNGVPSVAATMHF